ncbi:probable G-protein coupled receptor 150 [Dryobates pubescens]|uniref:probable G-protein coupled receptor 150 n=1 Tax=Dryobates pubescens TaxID=118200 RepID=UPI0023B989BC|nr:probable G-protein coupled receptor 150 [Dryobates pubescens]
MLAAPRGAGDAGRRGEDARRGRGACDALCAQPPPPVQDEPLYIPGGAPAAEPRRPGMEQDPFSSSLNLSAPAPTPSFSGPGAAWAGSVLLLALVGNGLVLRGLCGARPSRRRDMLLGHLALADLAGCGLALLPRLASEGLLGGAATAASPLSPAACRLLPVLQRCGPLASAHGLVLLALERHRPGLPARGLAALGWLLAPLLALPQAFAFRPASRQGGTRCRSVFEDPPRWHGLAFAVYGAATAFLAPAGLLGWACARSLAPLGAARRQRRRRGRWLPTARSGGGGLPRGRAVRLPLVLTALFALCRLPRCAAELGLASVPGGGRQEALAATGIVEVASSALNPFACLLLHSRLRRGLRGAGSKATAAACCCPGSGGQGRRWATLRRPLRRRAGARSTTGTRSYPGTSDIPGAPGTPRIRGIPDIPGSSSSPGTPGTPGNRGKPGDTSGTPDVPGTRGNLGTSGIPGTRGISSTPGSAGTPGSPVPTGSPPGNGEGTRLGSI